MPENTTPARYTIGDNQVVINDRAVIAAYQDACNDQKFGANLRDAITTILDAGNALPEICGWNNTRALQMIMDMQDYDVPGMLDPYEADQAAPTRLVVRPFRSWATTGTPFVLAWTLTGWDRDTDSREEVYATGVPTPQSPGLNAAQRWAKWIIDQYTGSTVTGWGDGDDAPTPTLQTEDHIYRITTTLGDTWIYAPTGALAARLPDLLTDSDETIFVPNLPDTDAPASGGVYLRVAHIVSMEDIVTKRIVTRITP